MPPWLIAGLVSLAVGVIVTLIVPKLTTKGLASLTSDVKQLKEDSWTTDEKVALAERLTRIESEIKALRGEVDFTKVAHGEFLRLLERALIPTAHSPHTPDIDVLLDRREKGQDLSSAEWEFLIARLGEEAKSSENLPGRQVALNSLRAIYLTHLKLAKKREEIAQQRSIEEKEWKRA